MFGHKNVPEDFEIEARTELVERPDKVFAEAVRVVKARPVVGAGGKIVQLIEPVIMPLARHDGILQSGIAHMSNSGMYAPPALKTT